MLLLYGYQTHWWKTDVSYKLYVGESGITGCRIGGQIWHTRSLNVQTEQPDTVRQQHGLPFRCLGGMVDAAIPMLLERYLNDDHPPDGCELIDKKNFHLPIESIRAIRVYSDGSLWVGGAKNSGSLRVYAEKSRARRFILLGEQDLAKAQREMVNMGYPLGDKGA